MGTGTAPVPLRESQQDMHIMMIVVVRLSDVIVRAHGRRALVCVKPEDVIDESYFHPVVRVGHVASALGFTQTVQFTGFGVRCSQRNSNS